MRTLVHEEMDMLILAGLPIMMMSQGWRVAFGAGLRKTGVGLGLGLI
jgi:hypothetical protein